MDWNSFISYHPGGIHVVEKKGMHFRQLGDLKVYIPRASEEVGFRSIVETNLRQKVNPGTYAGQQANEIIQGLFAVAHLELKRLLPQLASRLFFEFVVFMHSQWGRLMMQAQQGLLRQEDAEVYWKEGPVERRTLRYLLEECVRLSPQEEPEVSKDLLLSLTDRVYIAARYLVELSNISDQLHFFYPNQAVLTILPPKQEKYFVYCLEPTAQEVYDRFQKLKVEHHTFSGEELEDFPTVWNLIREQLNGAFEKEIGIPIDRAFGFCLGLKDFIAPPKDSFDVLFMPEEKLYAAIAMNYSLPETSVRDVIAGLTLTKESLEAENREVFDTKRHFQARLRPFAKLPHPTGPHLAWDTPTLEETLGEVIGHISFCRLPSEWDLPGIYGATQSVNKTLSKRFVQQVRDRFESCGWRCNTEVKGFTDRNGAFYNIANDPGEIDVLAVSPDGKVIAQVECKRLSPSTDTRTYRDDLSDFYGTGKFLEKAKRKHEWLMGNPSVLVAHLERSTGARLKQTATVRPLFVTLFPNFAATKATDIPILTAKGFFQRLTKNPLYWPDIVQENTEP